MSPKKSLPISLPQILTFPELTKGSKSKKTVFRRPDAKTFKSDPSKLDTKIAALSSFFSTHTSHDDPTDVYNLFSDYSTPCCFGVAFSGDIITSGRRTNGAFSNR
ncbi:MAG: hypothetical protein MUF26_01465, partial [Syntrophales bacterium]|nr:hypothetical protein [Syntrophales bacterium]